MKKTLLLLIAVISATAFYGQTIAELKRNAENGDAQAQLELGKAYYKGENVNPDTTLAVQWINKSAEQGNAEAQLQLGLILEKQAFKWVKKSAEQDNAEAQFQIGIYFYNGTGVSQNEQKAKYWLEKAAKNGIEIAEMILKGLPAETEESKGQ
jgi:uncharacterized protein